MKGLSSPGPRAAVSLLALLAVLILGTTFVSASGGTFNARAFLRSYEEVPAISSLAFGEFRLRIEGDDDDDDDDGDDLTPDQEEPAVIRWELRYRGIETHVRFAHIHFGQRGVNGGITVTLCSNAADAPAEIADCPEESGVVSGTIVAADVEAGAAVQGIAAGELRELLRAIRSGVTYVNVHSDAFPPGEIRGQLVSNYRRYLP